jgi:3-mercaptopyruvate sulfurtransferase SseA
VAGKLKERGIQAAILNEGWPAWTEAKYPTKAGEQP